MFTYKIYLDEKRNNTITMRLIARRKKAELSLGLQCSSEDFADALTATPQKRNKWIKAKLEYFEAIAVKTRQELIELNDPEADVRKVKAMIADAVKDGVVEYVEPDPEEGKCVKIYLCQYMMKVGQTKAKGTEDSFRYTVSTMRKYDKDCDNRSLEDINYSWLSDFEDWMKIHDLSQNTRKIHFGNIRIAMREAYKRELTDNDPFRRFTFRPAKTRKRSLSVEDLRAIFDYPVEEYAVIYRDLFKLIFLLIGINTVDLHRLKSVTKDGRIEYTRAKTGRLYSIKVEPEAMEIINKYGGKKGLLCIADRWSDHRNFRHQVNTALQHFGHMERRGRGGKKIISSRWPEVTTYWARHSWATVAASLDIPKDTIAAALGHGGNTVTDIYIDFDQQKVDEANRRVIDWVLYGKR